MSRPFLIQHAGIAAHRNHKACGPIAPFRSVEQEQNEYEYENEYV